MFTTILVAEHRVFASIVAVAALRFVNSSSIGEFVKYIGESLRFGA